MEPQPIEAVLAGKPDDAQRYADHAAVEGHAALPQLQYLDRVLEDAGLVEEDISQPAAEQDAERGVEDHVVGVAAGHRCAGLGEQLEQIPPADQYARDIGERIPADGKKAEIERDRGQAEAFEAQG